MKITIFFKDKPNKEQFNVIETYVCPENNELSVYKENETIRYDFDRIKAITTKE